MNEYTLLCLNLSADQWQRQNLQLSGGPAGRVQQETNHWVNLHAGMSWYIGRHHDTFKLLKQSYTVYVLAYTFLEHHIPSYTTIYCHKPSYTVIYHKIVYTSIYFRGNHILVYTSINKYILSGKSYTSIYIWNPHKVFSWYIPGIYQV